jgi:nucleoside 2-deoxyribosyltransferase
MKIYLAGPCDSENRSLMVAAAKILRKYGLEVYCPFELKIENAWDYPQEEWAQKVFEKDVEAINKCDCMLYISRGRMSSAGSNWEQGYAYALKKRIVVLQIEDVPTSLMTFCGCDLFFNIDDINELPLVIKIIEDNDYDNYIKSCSTILT